MLSDEPMPARRCRPARPPRLRAPTTPHHTTLSPPLHHPPPQDESTALDWAATEGHGDVAWLLLDAGADKNTKNKVGRRPQGTEGKERDAARQRGPRLPSAVSRSQLPLGRRRIDGCVP